MAASVLADRAPGSDGRVGDREVEAPEPQVGRQLVIDVPLGRRVMVIGDLLLAPVATASSTALALDVAQILERWAGPGVVVVCGNLFAGAGPGGDTAGELVRASLCAHPEL